MFELKTTFSMLSLNVIKLDISRAHMITLCEILNHQ